MRHADARRKAVIEDHCTEVLGHAQVRSLLLAAGHARVAVDKPRLAHKKLHYAALEELCRKVRLLHSQSTEQHVEEQRVFTLRHLSTLPDAQGLEEYQADVERMAADIRASAAQVQEAQYDPVALSLPENSLRLVCNLLRTRPGEAMEPGDHVLLHKFGPGAREHLDKLVLGALAMHRDVLAANVARNARALSHEGWAGCLQHARQQAAASEVNLRRKESPIMQELRTLVHRLEAELHAENTPRGAPA